MKKYLNKKVILPTLILLGFITYLSIYIYSFEYREKTFEVHFLSTEKSRSIFIRTPLNKTILIGAGDKSVVRDITKLIPFYSRKIDYVFIPSANKNQISGLLDIVDRYEVGSVILPSLISTSTALYELEKKLNKNKIDVKIVLVGDEINIDNETDEYEIKIKINFPIKDFKFNKTSLPELGLKIVYKNTSLYLLGNLSKTIQKNISNNEDINNENIDRKNNIIEFFNSGIDSKINKDFIEKILPVYIHTTKKKPTEWISDGIVWKEKK